MAQDTTEMAQSNTKTAKEENTVIEKERSTIAEEKNEKLMKINPQPKCDKNLQDIPWFCFQPDKKPGVDRSVKGTVIKKKENGGQDKIDDYLIFKVGRKTLFPIMFRKRKGLTKSTKAGESSSSSLQIEKEGALSLSGPETSNITTPKSSWMRRISGRIPKKGPVLGEDSLSSGKK